jgi:acetyl esterase/lipase
MLGDLNVEDGLCRDLAEMSHVTIVAVDYRLTPEHPWPAQLQDAENVYQWVCNSYFYFFSGLILDSSHRRY